MTQSTYNDEERGIETRKSIHDVFALKCRLMDLYKTLEETDDKIGKAFEEINQYDFHDLSINARAEGPVENRIEKSIDQRCWEYLIGLYHLEKYMLCTDYAAMQKQIENFDFPVFTIENSDSWVSSLKHSIHTSVQKLIEDVFTRITEETYWTGSSYSTRLKKKRNNNGIDKNFIITTGDVNQIRWYSNRPTITDDLEKACYIIDGKLLPDVTLKASLHKAARIEGENEYFKIRICNNGNTHYAWKKDEIRDRLNFYGSKRGVIGESIRIKIFEK